jgi:predicted porin
MNKKLLAVAVAGAFAAPAVVFAQSTVTLYGSADVAYVSKTHKAFDGATASKMSGIGEGLHAGNRIGFRGDENLGGGLTAMFLIEQGINITNGQLFSSRAAAAGQQYDGLPLTANGGNQPGGAYSTGTNRQAFVGLKGGWGEVLAGYQYTTLYRISTLSGFFIGSEQPGGDLAHGTLDNGLYGGTRANGITYNSPRFSNFQVTFQKGAGTGREEVSFNQTAGMGDNTANGRSEDDAKRWSLMLNYMSGPLNVTFGHTKFTTEVSSVSLNATRCPVNIFGACTATQIAAAPRVDSSAKLNQLGASYTVGGFLIGGNWSKGKRDESVLGSHVTSKAYQVSLQYTAGAFRPFLTLGRAKQSTSIDGGASGETLDAKLTQFGLRYDLSKRTLVYIMHGTTKDTAQGSISLATGAVTDYSTAAGGTNTAKRQLTGAGMYMSF